MNVVKSDFYVFLQDDRFTIDQNRVIDDSSNLNTLMENKQVLSNKYKQHQTSSNNDRMIVNLNDFKKTRKPHPETFHEVVIAIKQNSINELEKIVHSISDPMSPKYGQHLSRNQIIQLTSNSLAYRKVLKKLKEFEILVINVTSGKDYITASAPIRIWEAFLDAEFYEFEHRSSNQKVLRSHQYSIPTDLNSDVFCIFNTVQFPVADNLYRRIHYPLSNHPSDGSLIPDSAYTVNVTNYVNPLMLSTLYDISDNTGTMESTQAVYETLSSSYSPDDLTLFQEYFDIPVQPVTIDTSNIGDNLICNATLGGNPDNCLEGNLDLQYIMGIAQNVSTTFLYWNGSDPLLSWLTSINDMGDQAPKVISISYSGYEHEFSSSYLESFNVEAMKAAAMGITLLAAAGDDGVSGPKSRGKSVNCGYRPQFPASCPYVTAVGGTMGPERDAEEIGCQSDRGGVITSGGGFSNYFEVPVWQSEQVSTYLSQKSSPTYQPPSPGYSVIGRGYPDVSALAAFYEVYLSREIVSLFGTSAATPVVAGMMSLVNSKRLALGLSTVGWINPVLYYYADLLANDITQGENNCVSATSVCCSEGFSASIGWDPMTGLGSLNYSRLEATLLSLGSDLPIDPPTMAPITEPVVSDTSTPTLQPTLSPGWIYLTYYDQSSCEGQINKVVGHPTGACLLNYNASTYTSPIGSRKYSCTDSVFAWVDVFSDVTCSAASLIYRYQLFQGCSVQDQLYYYNNDYYSTLLTCSTGSSSNLPLPSDGASYSVRSGFNDQTSCSVGLESSSFIAYADGACFNSAGGNQNNLSVKSYLYDFPNVKYYGGLDCHSGDYRYSDSLKAIDQCVVNELSFEVDDVITDDPGFVYSYSYQYATGFVSVYYNWKQIGGGSTGATEGLSAGAIAGIVIGTLVGAAVLVYLAYQHSINKAGWGHGHEAGPRGISGGSPMVMMGGNSSSKKKGKKATKESGKGGKMAKMKSRSGKGSSSNYHLTAPLNEYDGIEKVNVEMMGSFATDNPMLANQQVDSSTPQEGEDRVSPDRRNSFTFFNTPLFGSTPKAKPLSQDDDSNNALHYSNLYTLPSNNPLHYSNQYIPPELPGASTPRQSSADDIVDELDVTPSMVGTEQFALNPLRSAAPSPRRASNASKNDSEDVYHLV